LDFDTDIASHHIAAAASALALATATATAATTTMTTIKTNFVFLLVRNSAPLQE
jgi:hypothetical protein